MGRVISVRIACCTGRRPGARREGPIGPEREKPGGFRRFGYWESYAISDIGGPIVHRQATSRTPGTNPGLLSGEDALTRFGANLFRELGLS